MLLTWLTCAHLWFFYRCICLQRQMIAPRCSQFEQLRTRHCKSAGMSTAMEHAQGARRKGVQFEITMWTFSAWMGTHFSRWISNLFGSVFHRGSRLPSTASSRRTRLKDIKRVKILAGRHKTEIVAQDFVNVSTQQQLVAQGKYGPERFVKRKSWKKISSWPAELCLWRPHEIHLCIQKHILFPLGQDTPSPRTLPRKTILQPQQLVDCWCWLQGPGA